MHITRKLWLTVVACVLLPSAGFSSTITFQVDPQDRGVEKFGMVDVFSDGLNGTLLDGSTLSLDLLFADGILARVRAARFGVALHVFSNATGNPGQAGPTTGFLLDANEAALGLPQVAGRSMGPGVFSVGIQGSFIPEVIKLRGAHFDVTLPGTGFTVTNSRLRFSLYDSKDSLMFGTAQQLPEASSVAALLMGLVALAVYREKKR